MDHLAGFCLAHWNVRGLANKEPFLKKKLAELGVVYCGIDETYTYRNTNLSDEKWKWDPGTENPVGHPLPPAWRYWGDGEPQCVAQHYSCWKTQRVDEARARFWSACIYL